MNKDEKIKLLIALKKELKSLKEELKESKDEDHGNISTNSDHAFKRRWSDRIVQALRSSSVEQSES